MEFTAKPIIYAELGKFKHLVCRSVSNETGRTGEFHIKAIDYDAQALVQLLKGIVDNSEIGIIGLDYDVYIKSGSILTTEGMEDLLKQADEFIEGIRRG